jgi:hypothetical protein
MAGADVDVVEHHLKHFESVESIVTADRGVSALVADPFSSLEHVRLFEPLAVFNFAECFNATVKRALATLWSRCRDTEIGQDGLDDLS